MFCPPLRYPGHKGQQHCHLSSLHKKKHQLYTDLTQSLPMSGRPFPQKDLSFSSEQSTKAGRDWRLPSVPSANLKVCRKLNANRVLLKIQAATEQSLRLQSYQRTLQVCRHLYMEIFNGMEMFLGKTQRKALCLTNLLGSLEKARILFAKWPADVRGAI